MRRVLSRRQCCHAAFHLSADTITADPRNSGINRTRHYLPHSTRHSHDDRTHSPWGVVFGAILSPLSHTRIRVKRIPGFQEAFRVINSPENPSLHSESLLAFKYFCTKKYILSRHCQIGIYFFCLLGRITLLRHITRNMQHMSTPLHIQKTHEWY